MLIYLASPYSDPVPEVREARFRLICKIAARLLSNGFFVYSPIAHTHSISENGLLATDWNFWEKYDTLMLGKCDSLTVVRMRGWETSKGIKKEMTIADQLGKEISYLDVPDDLL